MGTFKAFTGVVTAVLLPVSASAAILGGSSQINNATDLFARLTSIGNDIIYVLISLGFVYIVYGVVQYFIKGKEGESRHAAAMQILWGVVGLAIIVSLWGLVNILIGTFKTSSTPPTDKFPTADFINR